MPSLDDASLTRATIRARLRELDRLRREAARAARANGRRG